MEVLLAGWNGDFAGFLTIHGIARYVPFVEESIPGIVDFNMLKKYQRRGIGPGGNWGQ